MSTEREELEREIEILEMKKELKELKNLVLEIAGFQDELTEIQRSLEIEERRVSKGLEEIENWKDKEKKKLEELKESVEKENKKSLEDLEKKIKNVNEMISDLKCKIEKINKKSKEINELDSFRDLGEIKKHIRSLFKIVRVEEKEYFNEEKKRLEKYNKEYRENLEEIIKECKEEIKEKKNIVRKPILIGTIVVLLVSIYSVYKVNTVSNLVQLHEKKLNYDGAIEKANNKDKEIKYGSIGEWVEEGSFKIKVNGVKKEKGTLDKEKDIINITVENISKEDKEIKANMFNVVGENGSKTEPALSIEDKITQVVNRGRKATFDYEVYPNREGDKLELEFGRVVIRLYK